MGEEHFDLFTQSHRDFVLLGFGNIAGDLTGVFMFFAGTVHKSQGATVDHAYVLASRRMDQHLAYVAMTRHRDQLQVFVNRSDRPTWALPSRDLDQRNRDGPSHSGPS